MNIVFMGTPSFAASILEELAQHHHVAAVYTRPDAVRSRGQELVASPVKELAAKLGLSVYTPATLRSADALEELKALKPDLICVAAYGALLPQAILDIPQYGCINVHASLLPRWRGAAPIERAILEGDEQAGVCIMKMEAGLDTGDYCVSRSCFIEDQNTQELTEKLADLGAQALLSAIVQIASGQVHWMAQDNSLVTYADKLQKSELYLQPNQTVLVNKRRIQASSNLRPARLSIGGKAVRVLKAAKVSEELTEAVVDHQGGSIASATVFFFAKRLLISCADGLLELVEVCPQGKKPMSGQAFAAGLQNIKNQPCSWSAVDEC